MLAFLFLYFKILIIIIIVMIILLIILTILSEIHINIENLYFNNINKKNNNKELFIKIELSILNIKWIKISINKKTLEKIYVLRERKRSRKSKEYILKKEAKYKKIIKNILEQLYKDIKINKNKNIKKLKLNKINVQKVKIDILFGTNNVMITTIIIPLISTIITNLFYYISRKKDDKKTAYYYKISPIYKDKFIYKLNVDCIIKVKVVHIINMLIATIKMKRRSDKNERTSNRKFNDYCYE